MPRAATTIKIDLDYWQREVEHELKAVEYFRTTKPKSGWGYRGTKEGLKESMLQHQNALATAREHVAALVEELKKSRQTGGREW